MISEIIHGIMLWSILCFLLCRKSQLWKAINLCLLAISVFGIVYMTILRRTPGEHEPILIPGSFLSEAKTQPEIYRSLLMNVLLFLPLGLALSAVFSGKICPWCCVLMTVLIGFAMSLTVETVQYFGGFSRAEADDVLANTLGTFLGALHVPLGKLLRNKLTDTSSAYE